MFRPNYVEKLEESQATVTTLRHEVLALDSERMTLRESLTDLMRFVEDVGWEKIEGFEQDKGMTLDAIKKNSEVLRSMLTANPTIKKAINARVGYIWGRGVTFKGSGTKQFTENPWNERVLFDDSAHWRIEAQLATDGNIWAAKSGGEVTMIPIEQIAGWVTDPNNPTRVHYWLRSYTVIEKNFSNGVEAAKHIEVFYPASDYTGNKVGSIDGIKVDRSTTMVHLAANRQEGWLLGVPDLFAAMFWTKAHKELFEAGTQYVKAQGKFASKVISKTANGATNAAARIADVARRDPVTGEVMDAAGTAVMSGGLDYQLMGKMSSGVDFSAFDPVAGLIAAGLGVPVRVLLGDSDTEEKSLEQSTVDEMVLRQKLWSYFFKSLMGPAKIEVLFPKLKTEPEYRRMQSVEIANKTNVLHREELRQLTLDGFGIIGDPNDLPEIEEQPDVAIAKAKGDDAFEHAEVLADKAAAAQSTPEQGKDAGVGKLSTGKDRNAARDDKGDKTVKR
jgi:hypothetical protein